MSLDSNLQSDFTAVGIAIKGKIGNSEKGVANGVATLDGSGKVPQAQLPGYLDDVVEYATYAGFPGTGTAGIIYIDMSNGKQYRWSGSAYASTGGGAGFGLTAAANEILIVSNTSNTLTFTAITGLAPDATTTYTILGIPPRGAGFEMVWLFGGMSAGKYMIVPRGSGLNTADRYDVRTEKFEYSMYFQPQTDVFNAGSYYAYDGANGIYISASVGSGAVQYVSKFDLLTNKISGFGAVPTLQGTGVVGNRMEIITSQSGIDYLYFIKNSGTEMYRAPIWF